LSGQAKEMFAREFGVIEVKRARMRLLFSDADFGQEVDQDFGLDLKLPGQLVNSDLIGV
jgi:hypothetical protein